jgi:hypothetical protein
LRSPSRLVSWAKDTSRLNRWGQRRSRASASRSTYTKSQDWDRCARACSARRDADSRSSLGANAKWSRCTTLASLRVVVAVKSLRQWRRRAPASRDCSSSSRPSTNRSRSLFGLARQIERLSAGHRSAARLFPHHRGRRRAHAAREGRGENRHPRPGVGGYAALPLRAARRRRG